MKNKKPDYINNPPHYTKTEIEPIDVILAWKLDFCLGNVVKYVARYPYKHPEDLTKDLKKAVRYLNFKIKDIESRKKCKRKSTKSPS